MTLSLITASSDLASVGAVARGSQALAALTEVLVLEIEGLDAAALALEIGSTTRSLAILMSAKLQNTAQQPRFDSDALKGLAMITASTPAKS